MAIDDNRKIHEVLRLQLQERGLSRRSAIIRVCGEDSLRRVELKIKRLEDDGGLAQALRCALTEDHVDRYPMRLIRDGSYFRFECRTSGIGTPSFLSIAMDSGTNLVWPISNGGGVRTPRRKLITAEVMGFAIDYEKSASSRRRKSVARWFAVRCSAWVWRGRSPMV